MPAVPIVPTGSAYVYGDWKPSAGEIVEFLATAKGLGMSGASFWEWWKTRDYLVGIWEAIAAYSWPVDPCPPDPLPGDLDSRVTVLEGKVKLLETYVYG